MARLTIYRSDDSGAPTVNGTVGSLLTLLDACLLNGYTASVTSITRSGSVATVIVPVHHHLQTGQSVTIAGANESDYNGTFAVTVIDVVTFTYAVPGAPSTPATGTITWKKLAAGWTKPLTGTNKAAYLQGSGSNSNYLRIDDNGPGAGGAREARITGYETMSDVDTGTHPYPMASQGLGGGTVAAWSFRKSTTLDATARDWVVAADARTVYVFIKADVAVNVAGLYGAMVFGEFYSLMAGDAYRQFIGSRASENSAVGTTDVLDTMGGLGSQGPGLNMALDRGHNGTGDPVLAGRHTDKAVMGGGSIIGAGILPYTNPANGAFYMARIWIHDTITTPLYSLRGRMRGFWAFPHATSSVAHLEELQGSGELAGKRFLFIKGSGSNGMYSIEVSDTVETN